MRMAKKNKEEGVRRNMCIKLRLNIQRQKARQMDLK